MDWIPLVNHMFNIFTLFLYFIRHHDLLQSVTFGFSFRGCDGVLAPDTPAPIVITLSLRLAGSLRVMSGTLYVSDARIHESFPTSMEPILRAEVGI